MIKDYRFEQPNLGKIKEEQTKNRLEMEFTQTVQDVDTNGNATVLITITDLKIDMISKNQPQFSFDSQNEKDKNAPMAKLLGQSYTIQITPTGRIQVLDTKSAKAAVTSSYEKKIAKSLLETKAITERHQIAALPQSPKGVLNIKDTWSQTVPSPPGLLATKSYDKTYTLTEIHNNIATVNMVATESADPAEEGGQDTGGMAIFAKIFDNQDDYTGSMQIDLTSGQALKFEETLVSTYMAHEMPEGGDPEKGPDTLMMNLTNHVRLEKLD